MIDKAELCSKIVEIYPDIGECGIDIDVDYDVNSSDGWWDWKGIIIASEHFWKMEMPSFA